ncbi:MAG: CAP domain-containing protein [Desulfovibrio sp.]|nr:CAP domain-containing protein [Desulfovibrio sp.]
MACRLAFRIVLLCFSLLLSSCCSLQMIEDEWDDWVEFIEHDDGKPCTAQQRQRKTKKSRSAFPDTYREEEEQAVHYLNEIREEQGLRPLRFRANSRLQQAARVRAREIVDVFSHTRPDGSDCTSVLQEVGLSFHQTGENIAYGTNVDARRVTEMWRNSPGHYANMISPAYQEIGLASFHGKGKNVYWVQIFLTR